MKPMLATLLLLILTLTATAQPQPARLQKLGNYWLSAKAQVDDKDATYFVISRQKDFNKLFDLDKNYTSDSINFTTHVVLAIILPETDISTRIGISNAIQAGDFMEVYCDTKTDNHIPLGYTGQPLLLALAPRGANLQQVRFYKRGKLEATVRVK